MQKQIAEWLDTDRFADVNQMPDSSARFNFRIECAGEHVTVAQPRDSDHVVVACEYEFEPEFVSNFVDRPTREKDEFLSRLRDVLTAVPGRHVFLNDRDEPVGPLGDFVRLRLERGIFPDGGTQQVFVDTVEQLADARASVGARERVMLSRE